MESTKKLRVLLRVDLLLTFMPGGALAVPGGDRIVPIVNELSRRGGYDLVIDCRDDHPDNHQSFASQHSGTIANTTVIDLNGVLQRLWPDHAVHNTKEWHYHFDLDTKCVNREFAKGQDPRVDSYSAFYDNGRHAPVATREKFPFLGKSTGLAEYIKSEAERQAADIVQVDVCGLALGFCVSWTAIDARGEVYRNANFDVRVIEDAVCALEFSVGDYNRYLNELKERGISIVQSSEILSTSPEKN